MDAASHRFTAILLNNIWGFWLLHRRVVNNSMNIRFGFDIFFFLFFCSVGIHSLGFVVAKIDFVTSCFRLVSFRGKLEFTCEFHKFTVFPLSVCVSVHAMCMQNYGATTYRNE